MKLLLQSILQILAQAYLWRYRPTIVAITGNVGKTSTKEAIASVLGRFRSVRSGKGNLNNEFGVPLTILGNWSDDYYEADNTPWFWCRVLLVSFFKLFFIRDYPEILVLEYGADRPGDIKRLAQKFKPHIGVITAVGEIPVHVEYFAGSADLAREKRELIEVLESSDFAVLNFDDLTVLEMREKTKAKVYTYGFGEGAMIRASDLNIRTDEEGFPLGLNLKIHNEESFVPVNLDGALGKSQGYAATAAAAIGTAFGINLIEISDALSEYHGPKSRLKILKGIKNSVVVDDTYNASPASTRLALETLHDLPAQAGLTSGRKIAVLGDMLELGEHTIKAHQNIGTFAATFVDILVCVGSRAKFIAEAASDQMPRENIFTFETSQEAREKVEQIIHEHDLILVKGSQGMRMEKIVEEIMAEPEKKKDLLVRQSKKWLSK